MTSTHSTPSKQEQVQTARLALMCLRKSTYDAGYLKGFPDCSQLSSSVFINDLFTPAFASLDVSVDRLCFLAQKAKELAPAKLFDHNGLPTRPKEG